MRSTPLFLLSALVAASLAACGGSDDGGSTTPVGGGTGTGTGTSAPAKVSSANQTAVARATVVSGLGVAQLQSSSINRVPPPSAAAAMLLASDFAHRATAASVGRARPMDSQTFNCENGGTIDSSFNQVNTGAGSIGPGDSVSVTMVNCSQQAGTSVNGSLKYTFTSGTELDQYSASAVITKFAITNGSQTTTLDGAMTISVADTDPQNQTTMIVGAGGLSLAIAGPVYSDTIQYAEGMRVVQTVALPSYTTSLTLDGSFYSQVVGGTLAVVTENAVAQTFGQNYPSGGQVLVTGANGSALRIGALDPTQVRLDLDANGDGSAESTSALGWDTLLPY